MFAQEKSFFKLSFILIPFLLYLALILSMIDSDCKSSVLNNADSLEVIPSETQSSRYPNAPIVQLLNRYHALEKERNLILKDINNWLSSTSHAINDNKRANSGDRKDLIRPEFLSQTDSGAVNGLLPQDKFDNSDQLKLRITRPRYAFNCSNIHEIKLVRKIGHGVTKQVFLGNYGSTNVAVKMVTRHQKDFRSCVDDLQTRTSGEEIDERKRSRCFVYPTMKLMKEILLLEQLQHPGILEMLGYCARSEESDNTDIKEHGVVVVYELGERVILDKMRHLSTREKLKTALHFAELLNYLELSPLGSLRVPDFKEDHFLQVDGVIKMIDLDEVDNLEPSCDIYSEISSVTFDPNVRSCDHGIRCQMGLCMGDNARQNMKSMNNLYFKVLLRPASFPGRLADDIAMVNERLDSLTVSAQELIKFCHKTLASLDTL